jgi:hypothetical protein
MVLMSNTIKLLLMEREELAQRTAVSPDEWMKRDVRD